MQMAKAGISNMVGLLSDFVEGVVDVVAAPVADEVAGVVLVVENRPGVLRALAGLDCPKAMLAYAQGEVVVHGHAPFVARGLRCPTRLSV